MKKGLRGGTSYIAKRYAKANNKYMKNYNPSKPSKYITYPDMYNLYGWTMSGCLAYDGFKWLKNADNFDVNSMSEKGPVGYILKVDLEYPEELHLLHNDNRAISYDMQSGYCEKSADEYGIKVGDVEKLIPNLGNKKLIMYFVTKIVSCTCLEE